MPAIDPPGVTDAIFQTTNHPAPDEHRPCRQACATAQT